MICNALQNYYLKNKHIEYLRILSNKEYQESMGYTDEEIRTTMRRIWDKHIELSAYDEIVNGRRQKKSVQYFSTAL